LSTTFLKDIESFFSSVETSIAGKLSGATADTVKKVVATAAVAQHLSSVFAEAETTWSSLDGQSEGAIASSVIGLVHSGDYEQAAFGLMYLVYQGAVEATSKVTSAVSTAVADVTGSSTSATTAAAATPTNNGSVLQSVEAEVKKVADAVGGAVEGVVQKAESLIGLGQSTTVSTAPAPTPAPATSPVTPAVVTAPVVAVANPPATTLQASGVPTVTQASPIQAPAAPAVQNNPQ
jgi:hypothetical protein